MTPLKPISDPRPRGEQLTLWPWVDDLTFTSPYQVSHYLGEWAEVYIQKLLGGRRLSTNTHRTCPDIQINQKHYLEVKAIAPGRTFQMFRPRVEKYEQLVRQNSALQFVMVHHHARAKDFVGSKLSQFKRMMPHLVEHVVVYPAQTVLKEVRRIVGESDWLYSPKRRQDYQYYVRTSAPWLRQFIEAKPHRPERTFPVEVFGQTTPYVPIRRVRTQVPARARVGMHPQWVQDAADIMLQELNGSSHEVGLSRLPDGRQVRRVYDRNVWWYEQLRRDYYTGKKGESLVQRRNIIKCLEKMRDNKMAHASVEERLLPYMVEWAENQNAPTKHKYRGYEL